MKLAQFFSGESEFRLGAHPFADVEGISINSKKIQPNQVFVAMKGTKVDSHQHLAEVCRQGVLGLVVEDDKNIPTDFSGAILKVKDSREALVRLSAHFYGRPSNKLFCVGITGTNGKTSTSYLVEHLLNMYGLAAGVMGTIDHHFKNHFWDSELTTPDAVTLQRRMNEFVALGAGAAVFEVSSHALEQRRADGISFDAVVFTNLTRDHLDYHGTLENYFATKELLFSQCTTNSGQKVVRAIINISDPWGLKIRCAPDALVWTYGETASDFQFQILEMSYQHTRIRLQCPRGKAEFKIPLPGRHNAYNAVAALATAVHAGASLETCIQSLQSFPGVPGRLQQVSNEKGLHVFVDYAHTDDALRAVLALLNQVRSQSHLNNKIIVVFGCGGDRDKGKRPLMAKEAHKEADVLFITSDNPRTESPLAIILDVLEAVPKESMNRTVFVEVDRREAIRKAIEIAKAGDVILIAGKGHEDYQIIGSTKQSFCDRLEAARVLKGV